MDTVLAINNSPYYYFKPSNQRSIGYSLPFTDRIVSKLSDVMIRLRDTLDIDFIPGVQLGSESDRAVLNGRKLRAMKRISEDKGIEYVLHLPDQMVPGAYVKNDLRQRVLGVLQGGHNKSLEDFQREVMRRMDSASYLGCRYVVMHLPNGRSEDQSKIEDYLSGKLRDDIDERGLKLCIENCNNERSPYYGNVGNLMELVCSLGEPYRVCFDYGHYLVEREKVDVDDVKRVCEMTTVFHVHINDMISDKHLFLGERPNGVDPEVLHDVENIYLKNAIKGIGHGSKAFVIERNKPFSFEQLSNSVSLLFSSILFNKQRHLVD